MPRTLQSGAGPPRARGARSSRGRERGGWRVLFMGGGEWGFVGIEWCWDEAPTRRPATISARDQPSACTRRHVECAVRSQPTTATLDLTPTTIDLALIEAGLVERAWSGDHDAFAHLVAAAQPPGPRIGRSWRYSATNRTHGMRPRPPSSTRGGTCRGCADPALFGAWFGRIVVNSARSSMRGRRRRVVREIPVSVLPEEGSALASREVDHADRTASLDRLERALGATRARRANGALAPPLRGPLPRRCRQPHGRAAEDRQVAPVYGPARARARPTVEDR